jgi:glutathione peroxidase-family protein
MSFYDFKMNGIDGKEISFNAFKGKKVLIVNVASECGYTPQYEDLQNLHEAYGDKIEVLGFPANNFEFLDSILELDPFAGKKATIFISLPLFYYMK